MKRLILLLVLLFAAACVRQSPQQEAVTDPHSPRVEILHFLEQYAEAFNERDIDRILAHYAEDADVRLSGPDNGYRLDKEGLNAAFKLKLSVWENDQLRLGEPSLSTYSQAPVGYHILGEWPVRSRSWSGVYQCAMVVVKREGRWLIIREGAIEDAL